jgi:aspartate kinase
MSLIIMKFGGTSVESAEAMKRVRKIIHESPGTATCVVLSACSGVTNELLRTGKVALAGNAEEAASVVQTITARHLAILNDLLPAEKQTEVKAAIDVWAGELLSLVRGVSILGELTNRTLDILGSYGERFSSIIFEAYLRHSGIASALVDARTFMVTNAQFTQAIPDLVATGERLQQTVRPLLDKGLVVVTQGFIGATPGGVTTTIGRGGSDHSAALIGALLDASEIQIWTDVDGILTADPSVIPTARRIRIMSFREASELAYFGARVLHPETILPAIEKNIPVRVLNSRRPSSQGTLIVANPETTQHCIIKSVAYKENITLISIVSTRMFMAHGFLENVFNVFHKYRTVVHTVATSDVSVSVTVNDISHLTEIKDELTRFATVTVNGGKAIVCVVGDNLRNSVGIAVRILQPLSQNSVNINMISQGASEINVSFVIEESAVPVAIRALHTEFFDNDNLDPEIFD